jgi:amino acid adenylation domain-containing protein
MSELRERIAKLTPEQLALLQKRLDQDVPGSPAARLIPRRGKKGPSALSFAQERLWFLDQFEPQSPVYNITCIERINGVLNRNALEQALNEVVVRHESLHTIFRSVDGIPMQEAVSNPRLTVKVIELTDDDGSEDHVRRLLRTEARRPFDLASDLPIRATLVRRNEEEHWLVLVMHHIASDGWSMGVLLREISELYQSACNGEPAQLSELPIQYADFAHWQRQWLRGEVLERQVSYWKKRLDGAPRVLALPTDRPRPAQQTLAGARETLFFSESMTESLRDLARREGSSPFMVMLAALQVLLHRYTGELDVAVGTAIANRTRVELEPLIGFFANTLVLRTDFSGHPSFRQLLKRVRDAALEDYAHQDLPFEILVDAIQPERSLSYSPLFQVMFIFQNTPARTLTMPGANTQALKIDPGTAKFDLTLTLEDNGARFTGSFEYNTDLFEAATIRRMQRHFQTLLEAVVQKPDEPVSTLPILTEAERSQIVIEWNDTKRDFPRICVHELFEAQVEKTPEAVALVWEEQQLTYRELNRRANQLAHELRRLGVGPESRVGICVERSPEMLVGLLGILKAGGAYVPLDPAYPQERLDFMIQDAELHVLLIQERLRAKISQSKTQVVCIDLHWENISKQGEENLKSEAGLENLAYVIYTSGSTGSPKGVQITHRALANFLAAMQTEPGLTSKDTLLALTTISFDIAALEIYLPLVVGARLILASHELAMDGQRLQETLTAQRVTCMQATPATWRLLIDAGWAVRKDLKILCGGEALPRDLANDLVERGSSVWNMYGPSETTVWSAVRQITREDGPVPVGRPIANTEFYILDKELQPVPVGIAGELHIGGEGLARGYWHRPELTNEKFIPNPFAEKSGARLYKTGDLVRYRLDGNIEFFGRLDDQVKIRGFRVELGEIETLLGAHPAIQAAAVVMRDEALGDRRLVAYITLRSGATVAPEELRVYLRRKLPDYMLPNRFEFLGRLPLTPNGKVDRRALPAPRTSRPEGEFRYVAPRTEAEKNLAKIWAEVLKLDRVSIHDNFFDLGGHSLLATQVISRIAGKLQTNFPVRALFENPTVAGLVSLIVAPASVKETSGIVWIQSEGSKAPFFFIGEGGSIGPLASQLGSDQPLLGVRPLDSDLQKLRVPFKLEDIAASMVQTLRSVQPRGPYYLAGQCNNGIFAYEVAQQLRAQGEDVNLLALLGTWNPAWWRKFSKSQRFRMRLYRRGRSVLGFLAKLKRVNSKKFLAELPESIYFHVASFRFRMWNTSYKFLVAANGPVGDPFRRFDRLGHITVPNYQPKPYSGRVLLVSRGDWDDERDVQNRRMGWNSGLLVEKPEVRSLPASHRGMLVEPNLGVLAKILRDFLVDAQESENGKPSMHAVTASSRVCE